MKFKKAFKFCLSTILFLLTLNVYAQTGEISGVVFNDKNSNTVRDITEPIMAGVEMTILFSTDMDNYQILKTVETDVNGEYKFDELDIQKAYRVTYYPSGGSFPYNKPRTITFPANNHYDISFSENNLIVVNMDFGLNTGNSLVVGTVYIDNNKNGNYDSGDNLSPNQKVYLLQSNGSYQIVDSALTDINGNYTFTGYFGDCFLLMIEVPSNMVLTQPFPVNIHAFCDQTGNFNFGLYEESSPPPPCSECVPPFSPLPGQEYLLSAWVKEDFIINPPDSYSRSGVLISFSMNVLIPSIPLPITFVGVLPLMRPSGPIIEGWQRIEESFTVPPTAVNIQIELTNESTDVVAYFDDVRIHPFRSNMKSFVYNPSTQKVEAILDENNYSTRYEYDDEGILVRVKKETERGIMTIKETRNNQSKIK